MLNFTFFDNRKINTKLQSSCALDNYFKVIICRYPARGHSTMDALTNSAKQLQMAITGRQPTRSFVHHINTLARINKLGHKIQDDNG